MRFRRVRAGGRREPQRLHPRPAGRPVDGGHGVRRFGLKEGEVASDRIIRILFGSEFRQSYVRIQENCQNSLENQTIGGNSEFSTFSKRFCEILRKSDQNR